MNKTIHASGLALVLAVSVAVVAASAQAGIRPAAKQPIVVHGIGSALGDPEPLPRSVAISVAGARNSLKAAKADLQLRHYGKAVRSLRALRTHVVKANRAGIAQMSAPPPNPDADPPGPASVNAVLNLDHGVSAGITALFNGVTNSQVVVALRYTLWTVHVRRDQLLKKVIGINAEEEGPDYSDGVADTIDLYIAEVNLVNRALAQSQLTPAGRLGLTKALTRIHATQAKVTTAFGGDE